MIRIILLTSLLILLPFAGARKATDDARLILATEIVKQRYCTGDGDLDGVLLDLKLHFENTGQKPLLLYKGSVNVDQIVVRASPDGASEVDVSIHRYFDKPPQLDASSWKELFVILQPQAVYETRSEARVFVTREEGAHLAGAVSAGEHYLQVTLSTWDLSPELADSLREKWQSHGSLWSAPVTSRPMKFTIAKQRTLTDCR